MSNRSLLGLIAAAALVAFAPAYAADGGGRGGSQAHAQHFDARYQHNQYYPSRGYVTGQAPGGGYAINRGDHHYWYHGGVWYEPYGPRWMVVGPPFGVFVPLLPPFYTTVWFGGMPYYYANDTYYMWHENEHSYEVVEPPGEAGAAATEAPPPPDVFMYPRSGQSEEQQASDRYQCHRWAAGQTGFDPTRADGGVPVNEARSRRGDYFRAIGACLEGRGYSVK